MAHFDTVCVYKYDYVYFRLVKLYEKVWRSPINIRANYRKHKLECMT